MVQIQQRVLTLLLAALAASPAPGARRFYDDDPLRREPPPLPVGKFRRVKINEYYDFFQNTFFEPGKDERKNGRIPRARAVNTLGEVPDNAWYTNRDPRSMSREELLRGPGESNYPSAGGPWTVVSAKNEGISPGLVMEDSAHKVFYVKFDPASNPDMASAADVIGSKFFYDLGYNVPEQHIVYFFRSQLRVGGKTKFVDRAGHERGMTESDIDKLLARVARDREGRYRCVASFKIAGDLIGPFRYYGTRSGDPNDIVPHEDRRDLRGLYVFCAWLNHTDSKSINSLDSVVQEKGVRFVKHYLIDFGAILGSDSFEAKSPRAGHVYLFDFKPAAWEFLSLGLWVPSWQRIRYPKLPEVGRFQAQVFDPERWKSNYPNPAFDHRLPDDTFWAARKVMSFTDDQIRAIVATGRFTDPRSAEWISRGLIERRDKIGSAFFDDVLPLDGFVIREGRLEFEDLAVKYGFTPGRTYDMRWSRFDNDSGAAVPLPAVSAALPTELRTPGSYATARISAGGDAKAVTVYVRNRAGRPEIVGIDRTW